MLTYSTPEITHQQTSLVLQSLEYLKRVQLSAIQNANRVQQLTTRKPRVNFHSIEDLATTESSSTSESMTDSGFCSSYNQTSHDSSHHRHANVAEESDSEDVEVSDNKENMMGRRNEHGSNASKKLRTTFTEAQKQALDVYFQRNPYPDPRETEELSQQLVLPENVIKVWFQNKRSRDKQRKFSHKARAALIVDSSASPSNFGVAQTAYSSSPLVANLQMLTSRFNSYAAAAVAAHAQSAGKLYF